MELTKEQLEVKVAVLLQQNAQLQEKLLDVQIVSGDISLQDNGEKVGE